MRGKDDLWNLVLACMLVACGLTMLAFGRHDLPSKSMEKEDFERAIKRAPRVELPGNGSFEMRRLDK